MCRKLAGKSLHVRDVPHGRSGARSSRVWKGLEFGQRYGTEGKDFSKAISDALRLPAVVLNFQRNKGSDLTRVWG